MCNPPKSLACRLDWRLTFSAMGIESALRSDLPQSMPCPLCDGGALTAMADPVLKTEWFHCSGCDFAGDLIEFLASYQGGDIEDAVAMLETNNLFKVPLAPDELPGYLNHHIEYRARINKFWHESQRGPIRPKGKSGHALLRDFGMSDNAYRDMWPEHEGQLFGLAQRRDVEDLFAPLSYENQERSNRNGRKSVRRGGGSGERRVFPGHRWDDVIVVPFYDLPGRIIGFTFVGRGGDPNAGDFVYKRANIGYCGQRPKESGLGMMPALGSRPHHIFGNVAFVLTDAKAAIILHSSHLRDSRKPLPVVLVKSTRDLDVLTLPPDVAGRQLIFCGPLMKVLPLAHIHNGQVCDHSFTDFEFDRKIRHSPAGYLHDFRNRAVPWISALRQHLPKLARGEAEILISRLKLTPKESRALTQGLGGEVSERFAELEPYRLNRTLIGGQVVTETPEGWTVQRKNGTETICNYPIRVDNMLVTDDGQSYYEISVKLPEHSVDLVIAEQEVRRSSLFDAVFRELKAKTGEHLQFQRRRWAKESLFIAMQFSSPETIKRIGRSGWLDGSGGGDYKGRSDVACPPVSE